MPVHHGLDGLQRRFAHRLGVHCDKRVAAAGGDHLGAERSERRHQEIPADGGMLPYEDPLACKDPRGRCRGITIEIAVPRLALRGGKIEARLGLQHAARVENTLRGRAGRTPPHERRVPFQVFARLVFLQHLPGRAGELDAVPVEGDMASRHHDPGRVVKGRVKNEGRRRDLPEIRHGETRIDDGPGTPPGGSLP